MLNWSRLREAQSGFTLVELVIVLTALGILSVYVAVGFFSPAEATLRSEAEQFARDIRHLQVLAATRGQRLRLNAAAAGYSVACVAGGPVACSGPVIDPATGTNFSVTLRNATLGGGVAALDFDTLGRPLESGAVRTSAIPAYTLSAGSSSINVTVSPVTGFVLVTP